MTRSNRITLIAALTLLAASPAAAGPSTGLTTGGSTIAGPGTTSLGANVTATVYSDASGNSDACTTIVNTGRAAVRLTVAGNGMSSIDIQVRETAALCRDQVTQIDLTCLGVGTTSCSAQWRVDRD